MSSKMEIWLKCEKDFIQLPILPASYNVTRDVTGVEDVTGTTLNGVSKNYTVGKNKLPVKGELTCTSK